MAEEPSYSGRDIADNAFSDFLKYADDTFDLLAMTQEGARVIITVYEIGQGYGRGDAEEFGGHRARIAYREVERGFSLMNAHALIGVWGALESCIDDVCLGWLIETEGAQARDSLQGIRVPIVDALYLEETDRWRWLLELLKGNQSSALKSGAGQFESILKCVGIGGSVDPALREILFYAKAMRNAIAHRGGRVDHRFASECSRLRLKPGDALEIRQGHISSIVTAMIVYTEDVRVRLRRAASEEVTEPPLPVGASSREQLLQDFYEASGLT